MNITTSTNTFKQEEAYSISDLFLALAKNIKWVIYTPILTVILTVIYLLFIFQPMFTSTATISPTFGSSGSNSNLLSFASSFGISIPSQFENADFLSVEMYPKIVTSRTLAKTILNRKFDSEKFDQKTTLLNILMDPIDYDKSDSNKIISKAVNIISESIIAITSDRQSPLFTLSITSPEADLSEQIAYAVIEELDKLQIEFKSKRIIQKKVFIEERIKDVQEELGETEFMLKNFREQNKQIAYSPALLLKQERLERDIQIQTEVFISLKQQYETVKIEEVQETSFVHVLDQPNIPVSDNTSGILIVIIAGFFGLAIGMIISVLIEHHDKNNSINNNYTEAIRLIKNFFKLKK
ncbi:Wzz/FepE/Etk N-terminal domain-containing protein [Candidatus Neomarinimicrobiota bacterium]